MVQSGVLSRWQQDWTLEDHHQYLSTLSLSSRSLLQEHQDHCLLCLERLRATLNLVMCLNHRLHWWLTVDNKVFSRHQDKTQLEPAHKRAFISQLTLILNQVTLVCTSPLSNTLSLAPQKEFSQ